MSYCGQALTVVLKIVNASMLNKNTKKFRQLYSKSFKRLSTSFGHLAIILYGLQFKKTSVVNTIYSLE